MSDKLERVARAMAFATRCRFDVSEDAAEFWAHTSDDKKRDWLKASRAAIAALEPVSVQEAARVLLGDDFTSPMLEALDPYNNDADVWADVRNALRALAEKDDTL